jgi:hypothetical protein
MLIDISKRKMIDDRRQYKRAQFKMRIGQFIFLVVFIFIITMVLALTIGATNTLFQLDTYNESFPYIPVKPTFSSKKSKELLLTPQEDPNW